MPLVTNWEGLGSSSHMLCNGSVLLSASAGSEGTSISKSPSPGMMEDMKALEKAPSIPRARWSPQHLIEFCVMGHLCLYSVHSVGILVLRAPHGHAS